MTVYISITFLFFAGFLFGGEVSADAARPMKNPVEIVVDGKRHLSLHAYRLDRLKVSLGKVLTPEQLEEFSEEELIGVIKGLKESKGFPVYPDPKGEKPVAENHNVVPKASETDGSRARIGQMEQMLEDYRTKHQDSKVPGLDPGKVKTVIIDSSE